MRRFADGTVEFDLALTGDRSFVYLQFRMVSDEEHEEIYFRPHQSLLPDAIQYTPVFHGAGNWQLYHGEGYTAAAPLPPNAWIHIKLVVSGSRAAVFVGDTETPQMAIPRLARSPEAGYVAVRSFLPGGRPEGVYPAHYANFVVRPGDVPFDFSQVPVREERKAGVVDTWSLSPAFVPPDGGVVRDVPPVSTWRRVTAEPSGLVVIGRYLGRLKGTRRVAALAGVSLVAAEARTVRFRMGYSDQVSVFLNGTLLFSGDDSYSFNFPRRQGLIGLSQGTLYLPLRRGDNELLLAISDAFGGWGVMGRLDEAEGVSVRPFSN